MNEWPAWFFWLQMVMNVGFWGSAIALSMLVRNQQKQLSQLARSVLALEIASCDANPRDDTTQNPPPFT